MATHASVPAAATAYAIAKWVRVLTNGHPPEAMRAELPAAVHAVHAVERDLSRRARGWAVDTASRHADSDIWPGSRPHHRARSLTPAPA